jgi:hypothetical protein
MCQQYLVWEGSNRHPVSDISRMTGDAQLRSKRPDLRRGLFQASSVDICQSQVAAALGKGQGNCPPSARRRAGDHCSTIIYLEYRLFHLLHITN